MAENNKINAEELEEVTGGTSVLFNDTIDTKPEKKVQGKTVQPLVKVAHPSLGTLKRLLEKRKDGTEV